MCMDISSAWACLQTTGAAPRVSWVGASVGRWYQAGCLSPRYLYVNSRAWPSGSVVADPMQPPPIAEEIDLLVFDLKTMREVKRALRAHRAYTPNDECFFIFLDVSRDFVAR